MFQNGSYDRFRWKSSLTCRYLVLENRANVEPSNRTVVREGPRNRLLAGANVSAIRRVIYSFLAWRGERAVRCGAVWSGAARSGAAPRRSPGAASEEEVTMIYIRCYQSCSQPAIIPIIIIA